MLIQESSFHQIVNEKYMKYNNVDFFDITQENTGFNNIKKLYKKFIDIHMKNDWQGVAFIEIFQFEKHYSKNKILNFYNQFYFEGELAVKHYIFNKCKLFNTITMFFYQSKLSSCNLDPMLLEKGGLNLKNKYPNDLEKNFLEELLKIETYELIYYISPREECFEIDSLGFVFKSKESTVLLSVNWRQS